MSQQKWRGRGGKEEKQNRGNENLVRERKKSKGEFFQSKREKGQSTDDPNRGVFLCLVNIRLCQEFYTRYEPGTSLLWDGRVPESRDRLIDHVI